MECSPFPTVTESVEALEPTPIIVEATATPKNIIPVRYSYYQPWLGGTNCSSFVKGVCVSNMASGLRWTDYMEVAIACPPSWEFGTEIVAFGTTWICLDRGGAIQYVDGIPWIDFLTAYPQVPFRAIIEVEIIE